MSNYRNNARSITPRGRGNESRVSLGNDYDGRRVVNTPLSLHACQLEGVDPYSLTIGGRVSTGRGDDEDDTANDNFFSSTAGSAASKRSPRRNQASASIRHSLQSLGSTAKGQADVLFDTAVPQTKEQQEIKQRVMERRRQLLLASVLRTYKKLASPRNTLPPPPMALRGELPDDVDDVVSGGGNLSPGSARRKKFTTQPKSVTSTLKRLAAEGQQLGDDDDPNATMKTVSLSNATVLSEENSLEVARYFSKRENVTKKQWEANLKTELRDREAREHWQQQVRERSETLSARGKQRDEHLHQVQHHHQELQEQKRRETEEKLAREKERAENVLARKRQMQEDAREKGMTRGDDQRLNAMKSEQRRLDRIAEKNQEKADLQAEANARRLQERQLHEFEAQLNSLLSRDTQLRAARASEYKKEVFNERVQVSNYRANKRKEEMHDKYHDSMVQRDAVHRMKEQIDTFFGSLPKRPVEVTPRYSTKGEIGGDLKVLPPPAMTAAKKRDGNDFTASSANTTKNASSIDKLLSTTSSRSVNSDVLPQIEPPTWLAKEVKHLGEVQHQKRMRSASGNTTNSGRSVVIKHGSSKDDLDGDGSSTSPRHGSATVKRATHPRRWPFTAPESETKVAYPKWMYQSD